MTIPRVQENVAQEEPADPARGEMQEMLAGKPIQAEQDNGKHTSTLTLVRTLSQRLNS